MALIALALPLLAAARDVITLRDGSTYNGQFISSAGRTITFQDDTGMNRRFNLSEIRTIEFDTNSNSNNTQYSRRSAAADRGYIGENSRTIPAGAQIAVRTNEDIRASDTADGRTYAATVQQDVQDNAGTVLIPRGSNAQLVVRRSGQSDLALDMQSVTIDGRNYLVSTEDVERSQREGIGANRRTATMVGGGAGLGTLLGAIAGGGRGAAIGAIAGAAAGAGAQVLTRGKEVNVPAETVLTFRLDQPLQLQGR